MKRGFGKKKEKNQVIVEYFTKLFSSSHKEDYNEDMPSTNFLEALFG